ncbi:hypothetical protein PV382_18050 [Streptomyces scabiei]|uniref:hypothetical protein n=1 Tax=Streptomyces scabiei TaxID=1930 RepID=UPI0029B3EDC1|nr:hypothetical protein [Streptomyces scabiei]MDX3174180.1 hypothetical protein [Streptomyces scabiei]
MTNELTTQQLDEIEIRAASLHEYALLADAPLQADADQLTGENVPALLAEIRRLHDELAAARATAFGEAEKEIADAIDRNRAEHPEAEAMITRRLGMRAAERVVRGLREDAEGGCPGFEGNPVAPDLCAGCHEPRDDRAAVSSVV